MSKQELQPNESIVARKTIKLNGRVYNAGDEIKDSTVDYRTRSKLFRVGVVVLKSVYDAKYGAVVEKLEVVTDVVDEPEAEVTDDEATVTEEVVVDEAAEEVAAEAETSEEEGSVSEEKETAPKQRGRPKLNAVQ